MGMLSWWNQQEKTVEIIHDQFSEQNLLLGTDLWYENHHLDLIGLENRKLWYMYNYGKTGKNIGTFLKI